jgi:hypothetical protein
MNSPRLVLMLVLLAGACGERTSPSAPPGPGFTPFRAPYGSCDTPYGYAVAGKADCMGVTCPRQYYIICNGQQWFGCDCDVADIATYVPITTPCFGCLCEDAGPDSNSDAQQSQSDVKVDAR